MDQSFLERMGAFTFFLLGIAVILGSLILLLGISGFTFILTLLVLIMGIFSLVTGLLMYMDSKHHHED